MGHSLGGEDMITTQTLEQPHFSYRGRTSAPVIGHPRRWATAAAATKLHHPFSLAALGEHSLAANDGLRSFGNSFAELAW